MPVVGYMKILMDVLEIDYVEMEDTLYGWKAKSMIKSKVSTSIALYEIFAFFSEYDLINSSA